MKNIYLCVASIFISSCTAQHSLVTAHQLDRTNSFTKPVQITGKVDQVLKNGILGKSVSSTVYIYFDNVLHVQGKLDRYGFGELPGISYQDKRVSSSCNSRPTSTETAELSCEVFINRERATTLVMQTRKNRKY